jgi:hypothetical protein
MAKKQAANNVHRSHLINKRKLRKAISADFGFRKPAALLPGREQAHSTIQAMRMRMPRRPAKITQADIARAIRAAKAAGADAVTVDSDGVIRISLQATASLVETGSDLDQTWVPSEALRRYLKRSESG